MHALWLTLSVYADRPLGPNARCSTRVWIRSTGAHLLVNGDASK